MTKGDLIPLKLPDAPGVYFFKRGGAILYIGKAACLRDRVRSYFSADLESGRGPAIVAMVRDATTVTYRKTESVLEALILEANLIKQHQPPYNVDQKDNKSFNYLVITREAFPRLIVIRGRELFLTFGVRNSKFSNSKFKAAKFKYVFGPYPHGGALQEAVKMVRRIFPFRDKCTPGVGKPCFNRQIGLCPGVCSLEISKEQYAQTIIDIRDLFSGHFKGLKRRLASQMKDAVKREEFEYAAKIRRQISSLEHIRDVSLIKSDALLSSGGGTRIEAYDVAHTAGHETVGVMTVIDNGEPYKAAYRKFTVRSAGNNDIAALKEILSRRLTHVEWPLPRAFVVDGGKPHLRAAEKILSDAGLHIPVVAVTKDQYHRAASLLGSTRMIQAHERDILLANREAHRFALSWHRKRLRRAL